MLTRETGKVLIAGMFAVMFLLWISSHNFLAFHLLTETFSIIIAFLLFSIAWNSQEFSRNNYFLFLGIAYLFIGFVDLMHTMSYKGMNVFPGYGADLPTQLWIGARYMEAMTLVIAPLFLGRKIRTTPTILIYLCFTILVLSGSFLHYFPQCYIEGSGLTYFKKASEYLISLLLILALWQMYLHRKKLNPSILRYLYASIGCTVISEVFFTFYISVYGISNFVGHIFKLISFYLIYRALIVEGLKKPYASLFDAYQDSQQRYQRIFQATGTATIIVDEKTIIIEANEICKKITGYSPVQLIGKSWMEFVSIEDMAKMKEVHDKRRVATDNTPEMFEARLVNASHEVRHAIVTVEMMPNTKDSIIAMIDITPLHDALVKNHRLAEIVRHTSDGVVLTDPEGMITYANPAYLKMMGYQLDEIMGLDPVIFIEDHLSKELDKTIRGGVLQDGIWDGELVCRCKNGTKIRIHSSLFCLYNNKGNVSEIAAFQQDITEKKLVDERYRNSQKLISMVLQNMPGGYILVDENYIINQVNTKVCSITGYSENELVGQSCDIICPRGLVSKNCPIWAEGKDTFTGMETVIKCKNGTNHPILKNAQSIGIGDKKYIIENFQDIQTLKHHEQLRETIYNISKGVNITQNLEELYGVIHHHLENIIDCKNFYIALIDEKDNSIHFPYYLDEKSPQPKRVSRTKSTGLTEYVIQTGEPLLANQEKKLELMDQGKIQIFGKLSEVWLGVPLKIGSKIVGVMAVQSYDNPQQYTQDDVYLLTFVSEEISMSIHRKQQQMETLHNLREKEFLIQELYHRTKNNMQTIASMVKTEERRSDNPAIKEKLQKVKHRISSMALVHKNLYQANDLSHINLRNYVKDLLAMIQQSNGHYGQKIKICTEVAEIFVLIDFAVPLGLIISEVVTNVFQHAFPEGRDGSLLVRLTQKVDGIELEIADDGVGLPADCDLREKNTYGMQTLFILTEKQLHGSVRYMSDAGLKWYFTFPDTFQIDRVHLPLNS